MLKTLFNLKSSILSSNSFIIKLYIKSACILAVSFYR